MGTVAMQLMLITLISKLTGLIREGVFSATFGTGPVNDIYAVTQNILAISFSFLFMSMQSTFIPIYQQIRDKNGRERADRFTSNLTNILLLIASLIIVFCLIFMPQIVHLAASGFTGEKYWATVNFARIAIFKILFEALSAAPISYLNIYDNFITPATTGIILNFFIILFAILSAKMGSLTILAVGVIISTGLQYIFFPRAMRRTGYRHQKVLNFHDPHIAEALETALPAIFSLLVNDISIIINQTLATWVVPDGGASALKYANLITSFAHGIIVVSITTAIFPRLSQAVIDDDMPKLKAMINKALTTGLALIIPSIVGIIIFSTPIIQIVFERGKFNAESTALTAGPLAAYAPGLFGILLTMVGNRVFYSYNDYKTPLKASIIQVAISVVLSLALAPSFKLVGIAVSTSIANILGAFILYFFLYRRIGGLGYRTIITNGLKITLASLGMGIIAHFFYSLIPVPIRWLRFLLTVILAMLVYFLFLCLLKIPELRSFANELYHSIRREKREKATVTREDITREDRPTKKRIKPKTRTARPITKTTFLPGKDDPFQREYDERVRQEGE